MNFEKNLLGFKDAFYNDSIQDLQRFHQKLIKSCEKDPSLQEQLDKHIEYSKFNDDLTALELCMNELKSTD